MKNNRIYASLISILCVALISGCAVLHGTPAATPTPQATAIPPSPTPAPAEILFVTSQSSSADTLTAAITDFASSNSLQVRTLNALTAADLNAGTKIAVLQTLPSDLSSIAAAAPQTQFILLDAAAPAGLSNVSSIQARPEDVAFMAGYLTMLISQDWRAGALLTSDGPLGSSYADDFTNGSEFVCGKCNPHYGPVVAFPQIISEPSASAASTWAADGTTLSQNWLSAAYLDPAAASADAANAVTSRTVNDNAVYFISTTSAPQDGSIAWVALLGTDDTAALKTLLPQVLQGQGGLTGRAQITLTNLNEDVVTPAKQALFNQTAADLAADKIIPTTVQ